MFGKQPSHRWFSNKKSLILQKKQFLVSQTLASKRANSSSNWTSLEFSISIPSSCLTRWTPSTKVSVEYILEAKSRGISIQGKKGCDTCRHDWKHWTSAVVIQGGPKFKTGNFRLLPTDFRPLPTDFRLWFFQKSVKTSIQGTWTSCVSLLSCSFMCHECEFRHIIYVISGAMNETYYFSHSWHMNGKPV